MSRLLVVICGIVFLNWLFHFDAEAYQKKKAAEQEINQETTEEKIQEPSNKNTKESLIFPLANKSLTDVISGYGDPREQGARQHEGIDISADRGTPVIAVADGTISKVGDNGNAGKHVWLEVGTRKFFYAHLDSWAVKEGQKVRQGEVIGTVGNTGNASHTLPHLHFEVREQGRKTVDPGPYFFESGE